MLWEMRTMARCEIFFKNEWPVYLLVGKTMRIHQHSRSDAGGSLLESNG
jgi:hypothetical protein